MSVPIEYLDTSAIIKRYVKEPGSDIVRNLFIKAYEGKIKISFNVWNIGELLGTIDRAFRTKRLTTAQYKLVRRRFIGETRRMIRLGITIVVPVNIYLLKEAWRMLEEQHIYVADALQIVTAKYLNADKFYTGDKILQNAAENTGIQAILLA
ncbi:MAG: type II toxin-antitoxin system VapC family toxin [Desulfurococcales archaeon]|nr:type II toxin-antitoxin system VapC family toxin [Desulfurococcales archaeon]